MLYRFAVGATVAGTFSLGEGVLEFFGIAIGGTLAGWAVGRVAMWVFARLEDTMPDITVSFLAGFVAYLLAEQFHAWAYSRRLPAGWCSGGGSMRSSPASRVSGSPSSGPS